MPTEWLPPEAPGGAPPPHWRAPEDDTAVFDHPRFAPPTPQPQPVPAAQPSADGYTAAREANGAATASLVLGICGLVLFLLDGFGLIFVLNLPCSIAAWVLGRRALARIARGETPTQKGTARAGLVLGIVGTIVGGAAIAAWGVVYALR